MSDRFEDDRGVIQDMFDGTAVVVTRITTVKGAIRGNHVHKLTTQWTWVMTGLLLVTDGKSRAEVGPGLSVEHRPGTPHAWKAIEDTDCLVFTRGPRSGEGYESDTFRLAEPLLT